MALTDAQRFAQEYPLVGEENLFVYRTPAEALQILEKGVGVVYLGFPSCPWCQHYAVYLNEVAQQEGIDQIYYADIKEDRAQDSDVYEEIVDELEDHLLFDAEGDPRIYVPDVTVVNRGKILFHDNEGSVVTEEDGTPDEYRNPERVAALKERLARAMRQLPRVCGADCNG